MTDLLEELGSLRELDPGGLNVVPNGIVEGFLQQEVLRYRRALAEIELGASEVWMLTRIATVALDAGEEAAG